jgi:hypothetical protein
VFFLQEVKINNNCLDMTLFSFWKEALFIYISHKEGSGAIVLGLSPWIAIHVIDKGGDPSHSCVSALSFINGQPLGFCLLYSPNNPKETIFLWDWMSKSLSNVDWAFGSNFSMVEHHEACN